MGVIVNALNTNGFHLTKHVFKKGISVGGEIDSPRMLLREQWSLVEPSVCTIGRLRKDLCKQVLSIDFRKEPILLQFMKSEDMGDTSDVPLEFWMFRHKREVVGANLKQCIYVCI